MAGTRLVYGDGLDDLKDCFAGTFGIGSGSRTHGGGGGSSTRSSRQRVYGGDHYVHPHHLRDSNQGCCDCLEDFGESCSKTRLGMTVLFLWVIILTIVCIALGSNIGKNTHLSLTKTSLSLSFSIIFKMATFCFETFLAGKTNGAKKPEKLVFSLYSLQNFFATISCSISNSS